MSHRPRQDGKQSPAELPPVTQTGRPAKSRARKRPTRAPAAPQPPAAVTASSARCEAATSSPGTNERVLDQAALGAQAPQAEPPTQDRSAGSKPELVGGKPAETAMPADLAELLATLRRRWPESDLCVVCRAYQLAELAHRDQKRLSGDPYISHPVAVAHILAMWGLDPIAAAAALLHDVLEDTRFNQERILAEAGAAVLGLVHGLTKVEKVEKARERRNASRVSGRTGAAPDGGLGQPAGTSVAGPDQFPQRVSPWRDSEPAGALAPDGDRRGRSKRRAGDAEAETLRRMFMAASLDVRVLLIKLADRLHNMRTVQWLEEDRQRRLAEQTMRIYAPLADRLGLWQVKTELEDLSLQVLEPEVYAAIEAVVSRDLAATEQFLGTAIRELTDALERHGLKGEVTGRLKHYASIRRKLQRLEARKEDIADALQEVRDVLALRVVLGDTNQCYTALGIVHTIWQPIDGTFDDYIARPKSNEYQSLHTTVMVPQGRVLEVQIRTQEMHEKAELGVAAHWAYKEQTKPDASGLEAVRHLRARLDQVTEAGSDAQDFVAGVVGDVLSDQVRILTPKGDVIELPAGATPIDVAYAIHTEIGHRCRGAKVDGRMVALNTPLQTGQRVEIVTTKGPGGPSRDWLNPGSGYVATMLARSRIRQWFRRQERTTAQQAGRQILERQLRRLGLTRTRHDAVARLFGYGNAENFYLALGRAIIAPETVSQRLLERESRAPVPVEKAPSGPATTQRSGQPGLESGVVTAGGATVATRVARCCSPLPGDAVVGYVTRGRGVTLHRRQCANIRLLREREPERFVAVNWQASRHQGHPVKLRIVAYDRAGLVRDISQIIANYGVSMDSVSAAANPVDGTATVTAVVRLQSLGILAALLDRLETVENVTEVRRAT